MLQVTLPYLMMDVMNNNPIKKNSTTRTIMDFIFPPSSNQSTTVNWSNTDAELASHLEILNQSALLSVSDLKGNIIHANELFCSISKFRLDELINKPHSVIRHPDTPKEVFKEMWTTIKNGKVWQGELKNLAKDGSFYWVIATVAPVFGEDGKPIRYISIRYDISKQKQTEEELRIAKQKIDHELLENIRYAKHIHSALLSHNREEMHLQDSFLIYKAQKLISGDFYKIDAEKNTVNIAIGDSTGHGISASYISVLALNSLANAKNNYCDNPALMLKTINKELNTITRSCEKRNLTETADMMIACINKNTMQMKYSSARMRAFIIRKGEVIHLEKSKQTIGDVEKISMCNHIQNVQEGDAIYFLSDGIIDQFGGEKNKRLGYKRLVEKLIQFQHYPMSMQKRRMEEYLLQWQGDLEQTDDMTLFGIRI